MAGDIARVLAGLVGVAHDSVFVIRGFEGIAADHFLDHAGQKIVRPHRRQAARVPADRRAQAVIDIGVEGHKESFLTDSGGHLSFITRGLVPRVHGLPGRAWQ